MYLPLQFRSIALTAALALFSNSTFAECEIQKATENFAQNKPDLAEEQYNHCISQGSSIAESYFYLGIIYRNKNDLEKAHNLLSKAAENNPNNVGYQLELAVTLEWLGKLKTAKDIYQRILEQDSNNLPASLGVARMEHWQGNVNRAVKLYRSILLDNPDNQATELGLAFSLLADNKLQESRELFQKILTADPSNVSAVDGVEMLDDIRTRKFEVSTGAIKPDAGESLGSFRVSYSATPSYQLRWGMEYVNYEEPVIPLSPNSIPSNQSVESALALFTNYRLNARSSLYLSASRQMMTGDSERLKLHFEATHQKSNEDRILIGTIPTYSSGNLINSLSYAGYVFDTSLALSPMVQFFYSDDKEFGTSKAASFSASIPYEKRNYLQVGGSISQTGENNASSVFANATHYINRETAVTASLVNNFTTKEIAFTLGVIYEF
jgi:tetratricopeptide (TPR) repeat protein